MFGVYSADGSGLSFCNEPGKVLHNSSHVSYLSFLGLKGPGRLDTLESREDVIINLGHRGHPNQLRLLRLRSFLRPRHSPDHRTERLRHARADGLEVSFRPLRQDPLEGESVSEPLLNERGVGGAPP